MTPFDGIGASFFSLRHPRGWGPGLVIFFDLARPNMRHAAEHPRTRRPQDPKTRPNSSSGESGGNTWAIGFFSQICRFIYNPHLLKLGAELLFPFSFPFLFFWRQGKSRIRALAGRKLAGSDDHAPGILSSACSWRASVAPQGRGLRFRSFGPPIAELLAHYWRVHPAS